MLPCRFSFLVLAVVTLVFTASDQGIETLRVVGEFTPRVPGTALIRQAGPPYVFRVLVFAAAVTAFALQLWYCSRQALWFENDAGPPPKEIRLLTKWTPRILGALGFLSPALGLVFAAATLHGSPAATLLRLLSVALALGAALFLFVVSRIQKRKNLPKEHYQKRVRSFQYLSPAARVVFWCTLAAGLALFVVIWWRPVRFSQWIGAPSILLLCASIWIVTGTILLYAARTWRFPILTALLIWAVVVSRWTDNHVVRRLESAGRPPRISLRAALEKRRDALDAAFGKVDHPLFIVAAEGGGIRAAYWTAAVLSAIQDRYPTFAAHCLAISGVSGGSLGGAVFTGLVDGVRKNYREASQQILGSDFLSPTLARMFGTDLPKQFVPWIPFPDRGRALELAWEASWEPVRPGTFSGSFLRLSDDPARPILFLNGTWAETGRRIIFSPVQIESAFENAVDGFDRVDGDLAISTAVHMSARFTYVSPAATIRRVPASDSLHIVDGGYFEDSGAATASDILAIVDAARLDRIRPAVVSIRYSEAEQVPTVTDPGRSPDRKGSQQAEHSESFRAFSSELLSPIRAMLGARTARGQFAIEELQKRSGDRFSEFILRRDATTPLPLGWLLSAAARNSIDSAFQDGGEIQARIDRLKTLFEATAPAAARREDPLAKQAVTARKGIERDIGKLVKQAIFRSR